MPKLPLPDRPFLSAMIASALMSAALILIALFIVAGIQLFAYFLGSAAGVLTFLGCLLFVALTVAFYTDYRDR